MRTVRAGPLSMVGGCPSQCRMESTVSDLYPLGASGTPPPAVTTGNAIRHCPMYPGGRPSLGDPLCLPLGPRLIWLHSRYPRHLELFSLRLLPDGQFGIMPTSGLPEESALSKGLMWLTGASFSFLGITV